MNACTARRRFLLWAVLCGLVSQLIAQTNFSEDPLDARFVTEDVDRFWTAYARMDSLGATAFETYIAEGTPGLRGFLENRIISADSLYRKVQSMRQRYLDSRSVLQGLETKKKRIRAIYAAMKYWYPDAVFPPVYFVVGRFNSGGTVSEDGIILGAEMQQNLDGLPGLVAHELVHFQQPMEHEVYTLLMNSIDEGAADFIGELISGEPMNPAPNRYGEAHLDSLAVEFALRRHGEDTSDWLYGTTGRDARPNDLGYWIGYRIVKAYFDQREDKHAAIERILDPGDYDAFLTESGFLEAYISRVESMTEAEKSGYTGR